MIVQKRVAVSEKGSAAPYQLKLIWGTFYYSMKKAHCKMQITHFVVRPFLCTFFASVNRGNNGFEGDAEGLCRAALFPLVYRC